MSALPHLAGPVDVPHFRFPFHRHEGEGQVTVVEQDSQEHVMACVNMILRCPVGFRIERPEFGVAWHDFRTTVIPAGVMQTALREFEDRANIVTDVTRDRLLGDAYVGVTVEVESD